MKKIFTSVSIVIALGLIIASCTIKNNDNLTPTYRNQSTGTGANPNIHAVTVTGTQTLTNPATQNTALQVGGAGWVYESCMTNPNMLVGHNGSTTVKIIFNGSVTSGTFAITSGNPNTNQVQMIVIAAPGQPDDITWYGKSGTVVVTATFPGYSASFTNIPCLQWSFLFPVVTVSGNLNC